MTFWYLVVTAIFILNLLSFDVNIINLFVEEEWSGDEPRVRKEID